MRESFNAMQRQGCSPVCQGAAGVVLFINAPLPPSRSPLLFLLPSFHHLSFPLCLLGILLVFLIFLSILSSTYTFPFITVLSFLPFTFTFFSTQPRSITHTHTHSETQIRHTAPLIHCSISPRHSQCPATQPHTITSSTIKPIIASLQSLFSFFSSLSSPLPHLSLCCLSYSLPPVCSNLAHSLTFFLSLSLPLFLSG